MAHSQAFQATYNYDDNGNRTKATIIWLSTSLKNDLVTDTATTIEETRLISSLQTTDATVPKLGYTQPNIDSIAGIRIIVYPNPTHGIMLVKIEGTIETNASQIKYNETQPNETHGTASLQQTITVYDISGNKILETAISSQQTLVNLQNQTSGTYIMVIQLGTLSKTYTIIKQ